VRRGKGAYQDAVYVGFGEAGLPNRRRQLRGQARFGALCGKLMEQPKAVKPPEAAVDGEGRGGYSKQSDYENAEGPYGYYV
jgi:hypothetical protein